MSENVIDAFRQLTTIERRILVVATFFLLFYTYIYIHVCVFDRVKIIYKYTYDIRVSRGFRV